MKSGLLYIILLLPVILLFGGYTAEKTNKMRAIKKIHKPNYSEIEGLVTWEVIPSNALAMDDLDPFLLLNDHGPQKFPANNQGLPFGPHPHRGFETITFILQGSLMHSDNTGLQSIIKEGGIQWMTAGKGIIHAEVSPEEFKKSGGELHILQLWVNLPSRLKNTEPKYQGLHAEDIPTIKLDDNRVQINLISGSWQRQNGPVTSLTGLWMSTLDIKAKGYFEASVEASREIFLYVAQGKVNVNGQDIDNRSLIQFSDMGELLQIRGIEDAVLLFGHGKRINERVVARGPFVMNTEAEIEEAWNDYYSGRFGNSLPE